MVKNIPFFKDRGLKDSAIVDTLSLMTYKEMKADEFVIQYGNFGEEFYVILEGQCEVQVPDKHQLDQLKKVNQHIFLMKTKIENLMEDAEQIEAYRH